MRILKKNLKEGIVKILCERLEDLWIFHQIVKEGDNVEGKTFRSVSFGEGKEEKKPVFIRIGVEDVQFSKEENRLRLRGKIVYGKPEEFIQLGRYHTIEVDTEHPVTVIKEWKKHELKRLEKAVKETKKPMIRIVVMDEEKALTAVVRGYGIEYGPEFRCRGSKREGNYEEKVREYYGKVAEYIRKYEERFVVGGPGFAREGLGTFIKGKEPVLLKRISFVGASSAERSGVNEIVKQGILSKLMGLSQMEKEEQLMDEFMKRLNKDEPVEYGKEGVKKALEYGAIGKLFVTDEALRKDGEIEEIVEEAEKNRIEIEFFSSEGEGGQKLKGFGGIAALLKFTIQ